MKRDESEYEPMPRLLILLLVPIFLWVWLRIKNDGCEGQFGSGKRAIETPGPSESLSRYPFICPTALFDSNELTKGIQS